MKTTQSKAISKNKQSVLFLEQLKSVAEREECWVFKKEQMREVGREMGLMVGDFGEFLARLNEQNYLLMQGGGSYELQYGR